jgi:integrase
MPKPRAAKLESPTSRAKLKPAKKPYYVKIAPGIHLGYRRNDGPGTWSVRCADGHGSEWLKKIALADDLEPAAPPAVLDYWGALDIARKLGRRQPGAPEDESRPLTLGEALDRYEAHLRVNGGDPYNASRARLHLTDVLKSKPVALLGREELLRWRDHLLAKGLAASSVNRTATTVRAALELVAVQDRRIANRGEFKLGLPTVKGAHVADNVVLDDATVRRFVAAAYQQDHKLGLLADVMSVTGCRPSQATRLTVADLVDDPAAPTLRMPKSGKGGASDRTARKAKRYSVPITPTLAAMLKRETVGRKPDDLLLTRANGAPWGKNPHAAYRLDVIEVVTAIGLDPDVVTLYALRHSAICRSLKANVPIRVIAALADTSVQMIERSYSALITEHSDEISRKALLHPEPPAAENVVTLADRRSS